jgi:hypothetical protein
VRIGLLDALDLMNLGDDHVGKRPFIVGGDEQEDIRLAEA